MSWKALCRRRSPTRWAGSEFRKHYVLYCVPLVDKDGVEAGDQGKGRRPHDHNRDYGNTHLYPEIAAIQQLAAEKGVTYALDLHCPALRGDIHETFYFDGLAMPQVRSNLKELIAWIGEERPPAATIPVDLLKSAPTTRPTEGMPFSHYFAHQPGMVMAATLEVPYSQRQANSTPTWPATMGHALCRAWVRTHFQPTAPERREAREDFAALTQLRSDFQKTYRPTPDEASKLLGEFLKPDACHLRAEAKLLTGLLQATRKRPAEALAAYDAALADPAATTAQRASALLQRLQVLLAAAELRPDQIEATLARLEQLPYPSPEQLGRAYEPVSAFYQQRENYDRALDYARRWVTIASRYDMGRALNQVAAVQDLRGEKPQAIQTRQQAVEVLRRELDPMPRGVFGPHMAADLFDALQGIPMTHSSVPGNCASVRSSASHAAMSR